MKLIGNYMQKRPQDTFPIKRKVPEATFYIKLLFPGIRKIFYSANGSKVPIPP